ncbi:MAG TPA: site-2 protease family protein [Dehalococcoidales bacterium]
MRGSLKIARIAGIDIGIHYTWILAFFMIAFFQAEAFHQIYSNLSISLTWTAGFLSSILLFISVLLHELAHSLVAQARGLPVSSITLFIFGGVSNLSEEPERAGIEFWMAIVGPFTSLALGGIFWALWYGLTGTIGLPITSANIPTTHQTLGVAVVGFLAYINIALAAFNLLPGFPLDGGRVLRSILWKSTGNLVTATNIAATIGRVFGWGLVVYGVFLLFQPGGFFSAIWIAIIGFFLTNAAETSRQEVTVREHLAGVQVGQVMELNTETVSPGLPVAELVRDAFLLRRRRAVPVADGDRIVGMVSISDVRALSQEEWAMTPVERIMTREPLHAVKPDDDLNTAMKIIAQYDLNQVPVLNQGKLVGILSRANVINFLQLKQELGIKRGRDTKRQAGSTPLPS